MKRSLVFCAIALVAVAANSALATINVQLNLRYTNPAVPALGGQWELLAGSDTTAGLAGLVALIDGGVTNIMDEFDETTNGAADFSVFRNQTVGSVTEIVFGSDLVVGTETTNVGLGSGTPGNKADDLFPAVAGPSIWSDNVFIASGDFGATRPSFLLQAPNGTSFLDAGANEFSGTTAIDASLANPINWVVRGDSLNTLGLEDADGSGTGEGIVVGDVNRDGTVGAADSAALFANFSPLATNLTWDQGDVTGDGAVGAADSAALFANFDPLGNNTVPPAIGAVPEPSSIALLALAVTGLAFRRK